MKKYLITAALVALMSPVAHAGVGSIKVCDSITLTKSATTDCDVVELPASRIFSYQVYCNETTGDNMSIDVDWVQGSAAATLAVPTGVAQLLTEYATEAAWSSVGLIFTPIAPYGTIRFTENNDDDDIVCSAILNVSSFPNTTEDPVFDEEVMVIAGEATSASLILDADDGDDAADTWTISSDASTNSLLAKNSTSTVMTLTSAGTLSPVILSPTTGTLGVVPATQTIAAGDIIAADACGGVKTITAAGPVTTSTTHSITAPAAGNTGCCMTIFNSGANTITIDTNTTIVVGGAANLAVTQLDMLTFCSNGTNWYQTTALLSLN